MNDYAGGIAPRNSLDSSWWHKFDLKIAQELPAFAEGHKFSAFVLIENLGNLINDEWGVMYEQSFPHVQQVVALNPLTPIVNDQYVYEEFFSPAPQARVADASLWEIRFGVTYGF